LLGLIHRGRRRATSSATRIAACRCLKPLDRQVVLLYLEGLDAVSIGEVTGSSPGSIATKVHRLKKLLTRQFHERGRRGE
jgi:RNA polymerase sigma-70 factor (ECF subfamily)